MAAQPLTYLVKIDGLTGNSTIKGYEGYFAIDEFTFGELSQLSNGGGGGFAKTSERQIPSRALNASSNSLLRANSVIRTATRAVV